MIEENKIIVRRFLEEIWVKGNLTAVEQLVTSDFSVHYPLFAEIVRGPEAFTQLVTHYQAGLSDNDATIEEMVAEGDKVAVRWTWRAKHTGELKGIPATGKRVAWPGISIYRVTEGRIAEERGVGDLLGLMQQIGAATAQ